MIGESTLIVSREQLVAIVQEWWTRTQDYNAPPHAPSRSRVVSVWMEEGPVPRNREVRIELEPTDAPSK